MYEAARSKDAWRGRGAAAIRAIAGAPHWLAPALLLVAGGASLLYITRGTSFWFDEWSWIAERRGWDDDALLRPHNGHFSLIPVAVYKTLLEVFGLERTLPFRVVLVSLHLLLAGLVYVYVARRIGRLAALLAAAVLLLFGPGWQNAVWTFQITWLGSLTAGMGALLALDRRDRAGDVAACALTGVSLACSGLGIPIAAGLALESLLSRRRWWIVGGPLVLFALWWLAYQDYESYRTLTAAPRYAADAAAATFSSLAGLSGAMLESDGDAFGWGRPLAVLAGTLLVWRLATLRPRPVRVWTPLAILAVFWLAIGVDRAILGAADSSRYMTVGALFVVVAIAELARGLRPPPAAQAALVALVALVIVSNVGNLQNGAEEARLTGAITRTTLGVLELDRERVARTDVVEGLPGYPFLQMRAGDYFDAVDEYGSPAATPVEIAAAPERARREADAQLVRLHPELTDSNARPSGERTAPEIVGATGGAAVEQEGGCIVFLPDAVRRAGDAAALELAMPAGGALIEAERGAKLTFRRFATGYFDDPHAVLAPAVAGTLAVQGDRSDRPWHIRIEAEGPMTACGFDAAS